MTLGVEYKEIIKNKNKRYCEKQLWSTTRVNKTSTENFCRVSREFGATKNDQNLIKNVKIAKKSFFSGNCDRKYDTADDTFDKGIQQNMTISKRK